MRGQSGEDARSAMTSLGGLPRGTRERLAAPIAAWAEQVASLPPTSTLPLPPEVKERYRDAVAAQARELQDSADRLVAAAADVGGAGYSRLVGLIRQHVAVLERGVGLVWSLAAFASFGSHWAGTVVCGSREHGDSLVRMIVEGAVAAQPDVGTCFPLPMRSPVHDGERSALCELFDMDAEPVDDVGRFAVGRVHAHYAYRRADLVSTIRPHLNSLGLPLHHGTLAQVIVLGEIVSAPDPVIAVRSLRGMLDAMRDAGSHATLMAFRSEHRQREAQIVQSRRQVARALRDAADETEPEDTAHRLAEAYRRVVEGPVRHFVWSFTALQSAVWAATPGLAAVEDTASSAGGWVRTLAALTIFRPFRNGSAHESLRWDSGSDEFVIGAHRYVAREVREAVDVARSLEAGCESAIVLVRLAESKADWRELPGSNDYIVSRRHQTEAFFGANKLPLRSLTTASRIIRADVGELGVDLVNPALQALLHTRRTWPEFDVYDLGRARQEKPLIRVAGSALDRAEEVWLFAYERFPEMPFSAFLTINFDARLRVEPTATAVRAIHWIAIRDLLGAFALCEDLPREDGRRRFRNHLTLVVIALDAISEQVPPEELKAHRRLIGEVKAGMVVLTGTAGGALDRFRASTGAERILRRYQDLEPAALMPGVS